MDQNILRTTLRLVAAYVASPPSTSCNTARASTLIAILHKALLWGILSDGSSSIATAPTFMQLARLAQRTGCGRCHLAWISYLVLLNVFYFVSISGQIITFMLYSNLEAGNDAE